MNKPRLWASKWPALLASVALLAACGTGPDGKTGAAAEQGDLAGARIGGPFTLLNQEGKPTSWDGFKGSYRLVYFGYTYCPDVCPLDLSKIMAGFRLLERSAPAKAAKIQPMLISVDPARDTPAALKTYVAAFHPRLIGLTGTPEQLEGVKKAFVVVSAKEGDPGAKQDYLVSHSRTPYFFDPEGKPIALVPVDDPATPDVDEGSKEAVHDFLAKWVK